MSGLTALYEALGVAADASPEDIKKAFRRVARTCHPDVAGDDPEKATRFKAAREAYDVLGDPMKRAVLEAAEREARTAPPPRKARAPEEAGAFFHAFYRRAQGKGGEKAAPPPSPRRASPPEFRARTGGVDTLDDLFSDFGFGGRPSGGGDDGGASWGGRAASQGPDARARRGDDVILDLDVPYEVARRGGQVVGRYVRMVRQAGWTVGSAGHGVVPAHEELPIDVAGGTRHASLRRMPGHGNAGAYGGAFGDLVVRFRVLDEPERRETPAPEVVDADETKLVVAVTIAEALLGGRIEVGTPSGRVRMAIPPCSSSGQTFRLRGRGPARDGQPQDLLVELKIVSPTSLDDEGRRLAEAFARLYPEVPER